MSLSSRRLTVVTQVVDSWDRIQYICAPSMTLLFVFAGELRDAVKSGDYMSVKLALNSKEEYNLDQEVSLTAHLTLFCLL